MSARSMGLLVIVLVVACLFCASQVTAPAGSHSGPVAMRLPLSFEPNVGQADRSVQFVTHAGASTVLLTGDGATVRLIAPSNAAASDGADAPRLRQKNFRSAEVRFRLRGAQPSQGEGLGLQPNTSNYLIGRDPAKWHRAVPNFARVEYRSIYPGIDLIYHGDQRQLEYDFVVAPSADPDRITFDVPGNKVSIDSQGDLLIGNPGAELRHRKPVAYQIIDHRRRAVAVSYRLHRDGAISFNIAPYDRSRELVVDPTLVYSTYFGSPGDDSNEVGGAASVAVDRSGNAYLYGIAPSTGLPVPTADICLATTTADLFHACAIRAGWDVYVAKFAPNGALLWATYLGGSGDEFSQPGLRLGGHGGGIAADASGAYVTGDTNSTDFPVTSAAYLQICPICNLGGMGGFVSKLAADGQSLVYSTYLTSAQENPSCGTDATDIAVDSTGHAYITGDTCDGLSTDPSHPFPVTSGAQQPTSLATDLGETAFVSKLDSNGSTLQYSSYLGGSTAEVGTSVRVDASGNVYVTGVTASPDFSPSAHPTTGGLFTSTTGAASWSKVSGLAEQNVTTVAVAQSNPSVIYAGTAIHGIFTSTNGGALWSASNNGVDTLGVRWIKVDPQDPKTAYAGTWFGNVWRTRDGGLSWTKTVCPARVLAIDPVTPGTIYCAAGLQGRLFKSTDFGDHRVLVSNGLPDTVNALAIDPSIPPTEPSVLYAGTIRGGIFKSTNGAASWFGVYGDIGDFWGVDSIAIDPVNPATIYAGVFRSVPSNGGVLKSTDGGLNWENAGMFELGVGPVYNLAVDPTSNTVYAATKATGVFKSVNGGPWTQQRMGLETVALNDLPPAGFPFGNGTLAIDSSGTLYLATTFQAGFITKLNASGGLAYSRLIDGNGADGVDFSAIGAGGEAYITGFTTSTDLPTSQYPAQDGSTLGGGHAYVAKLSPDGTIISYLTYLGGSKDDHPTGIAVDSVGQAYVSGYTSSGPDFPSISPALPPPTFGNCLLNGPGSNIPVPCWKAFLTQVNSTGTAWVSSTIWGGSDSDYGTGLALDKDVNALVVGLTSSTNFPTLHAFQPDLRQGVGGTHVDAFVAKIAFGNTQAGSRSGNLAPTAQPTDTATQTAPVVLTFDNVSVTGDTTLTISSTGPPPPAGFSLGSPATYYYVQTGATFSGNIQICIDYSGVSFTGDPSSLVIMHFEGQSWTPLTTTSGPQPNIVCANTTSLSPFAVMQQQPNRPPVANAGPPQAVQCTSAAGAAVTLDGTGSSDPDQDTISYAWTGPFGSATGATPTVNLALGSSTITLVVNDGRLNSLPSTVRDTVTIGVAGLQPPLAGLVLSGTPPPAPGNALKQGRTLPLKLQLSCGSTVIASGVAPPQIVAIIRNGDALNLTTIDADAGQANDNGLLFRSDGTGNWAYNLSTAGMGPGTYTITIQMPDGQRYDAAFVLR